MKPSWDVAPPGQQELRRQKRQLLWLTAKCMLGVVLWMLVVFAACHGVRQALRDAYSAGYRQASKDALEEIDKFITNRTANEWREK